MKVELWTDGACSGNPGPGGYAAILVARDAEGVVIKEREVVGGEPHTTNNRMEVLAVVAGLEALFRPEIVTIYTDSQYVIGTMEYGWRRRANHDLWSKLDLLEKKHNITWAKVKGHSGEDYNERCDRLAKSEVRKIRREIEA